MMRIFLRSNVDKIVLESLFTNSLFSTIRMKDSGVDIDFYNAMSAAAIVKKHR